MRATRSKDGELRITINMPVRMSANEIAVFVTVALNMKDVMAGEPDAWAAAVMKKYSNRALLKLARETVEGYGLEVPHYRIGDNHLDGYSNALAGLIKTRLFK